MATVVYFDVGTAEEVVMRAWWCAVIVFLVARQCAAGSTVTAFCRSAVMSRDVRYTVFFPSDYLSKTRDGVRFPVVYLLHCAGCDDALWASEWYADVDRGIEGLELIAVAPNDGSGGTGQYGWWLDSPIMSSSQWATFVARELKPLIDSLYPTYRDRSNTALLGHSMGGFGALHLLITHDSLFGIAVPIKAAVDLRYPPRSSWPSAFGLDRLLGTEPVHQENWQKVNILANAYRLSSRNICLRLYSGSGDSWFAAENAELHRLLDSLRIVHQYRELPEDHFSVSPALVREALLFCDSVFVRSGNRTRYQRTGGCSTKTRSGKRSTIGQRIDLRGQSIVPPVLAPVNSRNRVCHVMLQTTGGGLRLTIQ